MSDDVDVLSLAVEEADGVPPPRPVECSARTTIARPARCRPLGRAALALTVLIVAGPALALTSQKISFGKLGNKTYGAAPFAVSAAASSGLPVSFASLTTGVCTLSGNTVTLVGAGKCTIRASQAGDAIYAPATDVNQSFAVGKANQTITFAALPARTFDASPLTVDATASSGLPVSFSSTTTAVCSVSGGIVNFLKVGNCTIRASQAGNANYNAASNVNRTFAISKGNQTIAFGAIGTQTVSSPPFAVSPTASSGLTVTVVSVTTSVCAVSATTVAIVAVGTCTLRAAQTGSSNWNAAPTVDQSFGVTLVAQTIAFGPLGDKTLGTAPFAVSATASSGLPVSFASLTVAACAVSGNAVTLVAAGQCTIRASQSGNSTYAAAPSVDRSFAVIARNTVTQYLYDAAGNLIGVQRVPAP